MFTEKFFQFFLYGKNLLRKSTGYEALPTPEGPVRRSLPAVLEALHLNPGSVISGQLLYFSGLQFKHL